MERDGEGERRGGTERVGGGGRGRETRGTEREGGRGRVRDGEGGSWTKGKREGREGEGWRPARCSGVAAEQDEMKVRTLQGPLVLEPWQSAPGSREGH